MTLSNQSPLTSSTSWWTGSSKKQVVYHSPPYPQGAQNTKAFKEYQTNKESKDSSEEESGGSEDEIEDSKMKVLPKNKQQRYAVSAEAYGAHNKKSDYVPKVIEKDDDQKLRIRNKLEKAFMFQHLDEKEKEIVVNAMEEKIFK
jgi:hypothetical protein